MIEGRQDLGFPLKPRQAIRVMQERLDQGLERDLPLQPRVARSIDFTHPAGTKDGDNLVRTEPATQCQGHRVRRSIRYQAERTEWSMAAAAARCG